MCSDKVIQSVSGFLGGVHVWGADQNMVVYAKCTDDSFIPVACELEDGRVQLFIQECRQVAKYHGTI